MDEQVLTCCLIRFQSPWVVNLPRDFQFVDCRVDAERKGVIFTIRSGDFPRVARGAAVPEFKPAFNGRNWLS